MCVCVIGNFGWAEARGWISQGRIGGSFLSFLTTFSLKCVGIRCLVFFYSKEEILTPSWLGRRKSEEDILRNSVVSALFLLPLR